MPNRYAITLGEAGAHGPRRVWAESDKTLAMLHAELVRDGVLAVNLLSTRKLASGRVLVTESRPALFTRASILSIVPAKIPEA